jgi:hypothetical protein
MTGLKWLLILAVLGYGALLVLMYLFQRKLIYFPTPAARRRPQPACREARRSRFTATTARR